MITKYTSKHYVFIAVCILFFAANAYLDYLSR